MGSVIVPANPLNDAGPAPPVSAFSFHQVSPPHVAVPVSPSLSLAPSSTIVAVTVAPPDPARITVGPA